LANNQVFTNYNAGFPTVINNIAYVSGTGTVSIVTPGYYLISAMMYPDQPAIPNASNGAIFQVIGATGGYTSASSYPNTLLYPIGGQYMINLSVGDQINLLNVTGGSMTFNPTTESGNAIVVYLYIQQIN
jgi:hypothetical protein